MKRQQTLLIMCALTVLLFIGTIIYGVTRDNDPYKYFTGLGSKIAVSPNDEKVAFSYFVDGKEAIYSANVDGTNVKRLTESSEERYHAPYYSYDGAKLLYLAENAEGIQTLYVANSDGSNRKQMTKKDRHVTEAVFSSTNNTIYYVGIPAEDFKKAEGETKEGFDLFSIESDGGKEKQLTDKNHFTMSALSVSPDGQQVFYGIFHEGKEQIYSFSLEDGIERESEISKKLPGDMSTYSSRLSMDGSRMAFTTVSEESKKSSLFEYDLFLADMKTGETKRLTDLNASVASPAFFHHENKIAFLENVNWASKPEQFRLRSVNIDTKELAIIHVDVPHSENSHQLIKIVDRIVSGTTLGVLYTILLGLLTMYFHSGKIYLPAKISLGIAGFTFLASIVTVGVFSPWYGIGIGMLAANLFVCTLVVFIFAFILKRVKK